MAAEGDQTDHQAVWDDSALVESWNQALEEYKKYHSIHAKGGSLGDLKREDSARITRQDGQAGQPSALEEMPSEVDIVQDGDADDALRAGKRHPPVRSPVPPSVPPLHGGADKVSAAGPPQAALGSMSDDNLKRLLMSWYYAGYYTGLNEGHQQAQRSPSQAHG